MADARGHGGDGHTFNQGYTLQGVSILLALVVGVLTILGYFRKVRRESEADARQRTDELKEEIRLHDATVERRLGVLEGKTADFVARHEIDAKIEHEKANRVAANEAAKVRADRHDASITQIKVDIGIIGERHANLASGMDEIKALVKEQGRDLGARLDKLSDAVSAPRAK